MSLLADVLILVGLVFLVVIGCALAAAACLGFFCFALGWGAMWCLGQINQRMED